jgi:hypothetical protein
MRKQPPSKALLGVLVMSATVAADAAVSATPASADVLSILELLRPPPPPPPPPPAPAPPVQAAAAPAVAPAQPPVPASKPRVSASAENFRRLRQCESNGNYAANTRNRYFGAYQFSART